MSLLVRGVIIFIGLAIAWEAIVVFFNLPPYILPSPLQVLQTWWTHKTLIAREALPTSIETIMGLILGIVFGCTTALIMAFFRQAAFWLLPILLISQAIPTFAIAPLLVIWFGYGITSKIITTVIMLFYPITSAFYDGLKRTAIEWIDLANTMQAKKWRMFWHIHIPAALPSLATGIRVAAAIAPIGAIVGEWVGASQGLGYLMLNSNARMQIDLMFAALLTIIVFSLLLYFIVDITLSRLITWQPKTDY